MRKERTNLELRTIKRNDGQLEWLPRNPRQWTQTDIDNTARSIAEDEDFQESGFDIEDAPEDAGADIDVGFDDE